MSLEGKATTETILRGKINSLDVLTIDAYGVAVRNGFEGTEEEWLASLKGEKGGDVMVFTIDDGSGIIMTDDGEGNLTISNSSGLSIAGDDNGNVVIA